MILDGMLWFGIGINLASEPPAESGGSGPTVLYDSLRLPPLVRVESQVRTVDIRLSVGDEIQRFVGNSKV